MDIFRIFCLFVRVQGGANDHANYSYKSEIFLCIFWRENSVLDIAWLKRSFEYINEMIKFFELNFVWHVQSFRYLIEIYILKT